MPVSRVVSLAIAFMLGVLPALAAAWQSESTLPVTPGAGRYLPNADDLGADWTSTVRAGIAPGPELFAEGVKGVYGGPRGSRAVVYVWLAHNDEATTQRAWQTTASFMDSVQPEWGSDYPMSRQADLAKLDPPDGCADALRAEGIAAGTSFPVGMTLCRVDPDIILLTIVSGEFDGERGATASDVLLAQSLALGNAVGG